MKDLLLFPATTGIFSTLYILNSKLVPDIGMFSLMYKLFLVLAKLMP